MIQEWEERLRIGIERFDCQHQQIFETIALLNNSMNASLDEQHKLFDLLVKQTRNHFDNEEAALQKAGFDEYDDHLNEHVTLLGELDELRKTHADGCLPIDNELIGFLFNWLVVHIEETDKRYVNALRNNL